MVRTMSESPEWLSRKQVRDRIGCSFRTIDHMFTDGRLTKHRDGMGRIWIDPAEVEALLRVVPDVESATR
jgi:hypothetical protein